MTAPADILHTLRFGPLTPTQIASRVGITPKHASRCLWRLVEQKRVKAGQGDCMSQGVSYVFSLNEVKS